MRLPSAPLARLALGLALLLPVALPRPVRAQYLTRPHLEWRTLRTEHFTFHFPAAMTAWTRDVAARMESVHEAVTTLVGYEPERRVTVLVEDPSNVSNGFALPFRDAPTIFLWPTPPEPTTTIAHHRGWGELLAVHEYAHVAHLTRPTRNPRQAWLWRLLPVELGPIARRAPRWVIEGYATYVEGLLTGSGRPPSAGRAAVLRQWALEGQLPSYAQLNGAQRFQGGSMAYLAGSAYLEWLVRREGEQSLRDLWRRMTARQDRGFVPAFVGVFGAPPDELYGRFTAELTGQALAVEDTLARRGLAEGELVQRLSWGTGQPAVSADGAHMAVVLRSATQPSRLVVWRTQEPPDTAAPRARARLLERDPEDVLPVQRRPRPRRALATLHPVAGRAHDRPRFLPGGRELLVVRPVPTGDGTERPELFVWRWRSGGLRQVTRGASVREADPAPDGRSAAGVRCLNGVCDLVRITLDRGTLSVIAPGSPARSFWYPRVSPDGRRVVVSVHEGGRWRLAEVPLTGGTPRWVDPDDGADRYGAAYLPGGAGLVATSERGGIAHLERISLADGATRALTRTTAAHGSPSVDPTTRHVYFLSLHARGNDVRRVHADSTRDAPASWVAGALYPAAPPASVAADADSFPARPLPAAASYGLGPRARRLLPGVVAGTEGALGTLALTGNDPVGRFGWVLQGALGDRGTWRGGSLGAELRTLVPYVHAELFATRHEPSRQSESPVTRAAVGAALDVDYLGAAIGARMARDHGTFGWGAGGGLALGRLDHRAGTLPDAPGGVPGDARLERSLAHATVSGSARWQRGRSGVSHRLTLHGASGRTGAEHWTRGTAAAELAVSLRGYGGRGLVRYGRTGAAGPAYEQFVIGGVRSPLVDPALLSQRLAMPALPFGVAAGRQALEYRVQSSLLGTTVYYAGAAAGDELDEWHRVVGAEWELGVPAITFVALPAVRVLGGVGYSLDEPFRRRPRGYASITYTP